MVSAKCSPLEDFDQLILNQFQTASKCPAPSLRKFFLYNFFSSFQITNTNTKYKLLFNNCIHQGGDQRGSPPEA